MDKKYNVEKRDVGVTVARFQIDELHPAHLELLNIMLETHKRIIVIIGLNSLKRPTANNPLDFKMRRDMIFETIGRMNVHVLYINDHKSDYIWSCLLDKLIIRNTKDTETIRLCGGRDSFLQAYTEDTFDTWVIDEFEQSEFISATSRRKEIATSTDFDKSFRRGVIYSALNIVPQCIPSIDIAIFNQAKTHILMGKRFDDDGGLSFIGSGVRPGETFEDACHRVAMQKAGVAIEALFPRRSFTDHDWRFRNECDNLTTMVYVARIKHGTPTALANFELLKWTPIKDVVDVATKTHLDIAKYIQKNSYI